MRNKLPNSPRKIESAIINLDNFEGPGTHWVAYKKFGNSVLYYDSFGKLPPPLELLKYFGSNIKIKYNYNSDQSFNSFRCGHLCLKFLHTKNAYV